MQCLESPAAVLVRGEETRAGRPKYMPASVGEKPCEPLREKTGSRIKRQSEGFSEGLRLGLVRNPTQLATSEFSRSVHTIER